MYFMRSQFMLAIAAMSLLSVSALSRAQDSQVRRQAAVTPVPGLSAALAQLPTGEAVAVYANSELTIVAQRAALIDVLREACSQIGAELDAPAEANEPLVGVFGPGPAREVLAALLDGSQYELGTAGSMAEPNALIRIVILRKSKTKDTARQENKAPNALNAIAEPGPQPQVDLASTGEKANVQQMLQLLDEAKINFVDNEVDQDDPSGKVVKGQTGDLFKALESLIKTAAAAEAGDGNPSTTAQKAGNGRSVGSAVPAPQTYGRR